MAAPRRARFRRPKAPAAPLVAERRLSDELRVDERLELLRTARVPQLAQRLGFDLADALAGDLEVLTHFLEGVVALFADAEAHAQDLLFARRERLQHFSRLLGEVHVDDRLGRRDD